MTETAPVQAFQIGQRVRRNEAKQDDHRRPFIIQAIYHTSPGLVLYSSEDGYSASTADELSLAPEGAPYEPTERLTITRRETDDEIAERHADERAKYAGFNEFDEVTP